MLDTRNAKRLEVQRRAAVFRRRIMQDAQDLPDNPTREQAQLVILQILDHFNETLLLPEYQLRKSRVERTQKQLDDLIHDINVEHSTPPQQHEAKE